MATITLTTHDPLGRLSALPLLRPTLQAAIDYIDRYVVFRGTIDVEINVESTSAGRFAGWGDTMFARHVGGLDLWESSLAAEARTGIDPYPVKADLSIYIDPSYLAQVWWDPTIASSLGANPPNDKTDAFSLFVHEILHGMGIGGWRDINTGALPSNYASVWDSQVTVSGGHATFGGAATIALLGEPVEVRLGGSQGAFHLGNGPNLEASTMPWIERANFNGYYYFLGERYTLGRLELALLDDIGWTLKPNITLTDVVNRWDDRVTPLYQVGWDRNEHLVGDVLDDRLEGRGGNDLLVGLDGNDYLDGGDGNDTIVAGDGNDTTHAGTGNDTLDGGSGIDIATYSGTRTSNTLTRNVAGWTVSSSADGTDALTNIERLQFSDKTIALDIDGNAGQVYRLYQAAFNRTPDKGGLGDWIYGMDHGMSLLDVSAGFVNSSEFRSVYGQDPTNAEVVARFYQNVLHRVAEQAGFDYWMNQIESGLQTRTQVLTGFSESPENQLQVIGVIQNGIEYTQHLA